MFFKFFFSFFGHRKKSNTNFREILTFLRSGTIVLYKNIKKKFEIFLTFFMSTKSVEGIGVEARQTPQNDQ